MRWTLIIRLKPTSLTQFLHIATVLQYSLRLATSNPDYITNNSSGRIQ